MNIKEIAQLAGVSASTVSKIVNQKDESISSETRERVLKIVKEYNYTPYAAATVNPAKTWILGVLLRSSISLDSTLDGIMQTAQANGYSVLVYNSYSDIEQELKNITSLCKNNVDGIIWEPVSRESLSYTSQFQNMNIPMMTIGPNGGDHSHMIPYEEAAYRITQELINRRHKDIACILKEGRRTDAFLNGYKKCLFDNHRKLDKDLIFYNLDEALIHKVNSHSISGVISSHYREALKFYQLMNTLNYRIPEDISLISLKNDTMEDLAFPDISEISTYTMLNADFGSYLCNKMIAEIEKRTDTLHSFVQEFQLDNQTTVSVPFNLNAPKITVVGSINIDTYLNVPQLPHSGKTVSTSSSFIYPGGKGMNQSIGAAKLGHRVTLIGNVGSDLDSASIYKSLKEYGVEPFGVKRCSQTDTGKAFIFVESGGQSMISVLPGANDMLTPEDIRNRRRFFKNTGYCLIQSEIPLDTVAEACRIAHEYGAKTILKPSVYGKIPKEVLSEVDILVPNEDELNELCPGPYTLQEKTASLLECGIEIIIVTQGEKGCYVRSDELEMYFPAVSFPAVDNTGASDAFISALAAYLLYGYSLEQAVKIATYAAGFCISREGVVPALIDQRSLETFIKQKEDSLI
ncbi:PfkB family carbohydrate kinase [Anaerostipes sp.]|uniref:PfkB family carbohydrate kinase n=1 Tax=Anaerostipes sp. TaxID=1872530 RepID=UPI0025B89599|nr:PfkB family carbohydrate kinase [Anaerostipes sp.]MBS7008103.1 LacI family DNA-binding transcriptional regulator [Anaerostipes sp.]